MNTRTITESPSRLIAFFAAGLCVLTASSYISVPMFPVPVTMQTLAIVMVGALAGPRLGTAIVMSWLGLSIMVAPVLAGGKTGIIAFTGPTAGYLAAFPIAALLGGLVARASNSVIHFVGFLGVHAIILAAGWVWLATLIGPEAAFTSGVAPFAIGALLKSGLAASLLVALTKRP